MHFLLRQLQRDFIKIEAFLDEYPAFEFKMNPAQKQIYADEWIAYTELLLWGNRSGKTTIGVLEVYAHCIGYRPWLPPTHRHHIVRNLQGKPVIPPTIIRVIGMEFGEHVKKTLWTAFKDWLPKIENKAKFYLHRHPTGAVDQIRFKENGSEVNFITDMQLSAAEGPKFHFVWQDELSNRDVWQASMRGLVDFHGTAMITLTPYDAKDTRRNARYISWIKNDIYLKAIEQAAKRKRDPSFRPLFRAHIAHSDSNVGYGITREALEVFASTLTEEEKQARLFGKFITWGGTVYNLRHQHKRAMPHSDKDPTWIGIDPHPEKDHFALFARVLRKGEQNDDDHLHFWACLNEREIKRFAEGLIEREPRIVDAKRCDECILVIDPTFAAKTDWGSNIDFIGYLRQYHIKSAIHMAEHSPGSVQRGIILANKRFAENTISFDPSLTPVFEEFDRYIRDKKGNPVKDGIDYLDCMRMILQDDPRLFVTERRDEEYVSNMRAFDVAMRAALS